MTLVLLELVSVVQQQLFVYLRFVFKWLLRQQSGQAKTVLWIIVTATL